MRSLMEFDHRKATQAINYLALCERGPIGKLKLIKLVYLADRYHLRRYGRPIFNDYYLAMEMGPVGSSVKDIAELSSFLDDNEREYAAKFIEQGQTPNTVASHAPVDVKVFSETEKEALRFAYDQFGKLSLSALIRLVHRYPEWDKFRTILGPEISRVPMSYVDFFENPPDPAADVFALPEDVLEASRQVFEENLAVAELWK